MLLLQHPVFGTGSTEMISTRAPPALIPRLRGFVREQLPPPPAMTLTRVIPMRHRRAIPAALHPDSAAGWRKTPCTSPSVREETSVQEPPRRTSERSLVGTAPPSRRAAGTTTPSVPRGSGARSALIGPRGQRSAGTPSWRLGQGGTPRDKKGQTGINWDKPGQTETNRDNPAAPRTAAVPCQGPRPG